MTKAISSALAALASLCLPACTVLDQTKSTKGAIMQFGADSAVPGVEADNDGPIKKVFLPQELDPDNAGGWQTKGYSDQQALSAALQGFYKKAYDGSDRNLNLMLRRNRVQDRIVMASNQGCDIYKRHLLAVQSVVNYTYGNFELLTAGLGAILKPAGTSQALAGASAILSGSRAEWNDDFFRKLLAEVITRGISVERQTYFEFIDQQQKLSIERYSMEAAIADGLQYHAKCTLIAGLENAQKSQSFYADPGLIRLAQLSGASAHDLFGKVLSSAAPAPVPSPSPAVTPTPTPTVTPQVLKRPE